MTGTAEEFSQNRRSLNMCQPTTCRVCGKTTWKGCGDHIEAVKARVPADQWCAGHDEPQSNNRTRRFLRF